ncbi:MAG: inositol monophosphatase family protein, partial [Planctomycetota bacterium]
MWACERAVAVAAARAGGRAALPHFRRADLQVEHKADDSPVTIADRASESAARELIHAAFPADGWLGEETGSSDGCSDRRWVVDPIDGTRNFLRGIPLWSTLVACEQRQADGV